MEETSATVARLKSEQEKGRRAMNELKRANSTLKVSINEAKEFNVSQIYMCMQSYVLFESELQKKLGNAEREISSTKKYLSQLEAEYEKLQKIHVLFIK